ncbi:MAG: acyltransferase family protein, partial [Muribaculaceae bacterium]|nr:acyltransferase family protein [Muribaculaceae bacterium]
MAAERNTSMSIVKAVAIILMVMGHAEGPWWVTNFIYLFHMPVFFIAAGYFFKRSAIDQPWQFVTRRFRKLYVPMVEWSI